MKPDDKKDGGAARRPYKSPVLEVYGDIRNLTKFISGGKGKNDMTSGPEKTSP